MRPPVGTIRVVTMSVGNIRQKDGAVYWSTVVSRPLRGCTIRVSRGSPMKLNPQISLGFNGQCEAAFRFYEQNLNGTVTYMLKWGDSPMAAEAPPGYASKIAHATLKVGELGIAGS